MVRIARFEFLVAVFVIGFVVVPPTGTSAQDSRGVTTESLQKEIQELRENYQREIEQLQRRVEELQAQSPPSSRKPGQLKGKASRPQQETPPVTIATEKAHTEKEARQQRTEKGTETILVEQGGILLRRGTLSVEPSLNYTHFSTNSLLVSGFTLLDAILIGRIQVEEIKRDILTSSLTLRYGLTNRFQVEARVPGVYRRDRLVHPQTQTSDGAIQQVRTLDGFGLGDIEAAASFHAYQSTNWLPDVLLNVRGKTRTGRDPYSLETEVIQGVTLSREVATGSGHYGISGGLTLVKAFDPVVFFTSGSYFWNAKRQVGGVFGDIDPGDSIEYNLGLAVALSERTALNLAFQNIFTMTTEQNGRTIPETELNAAILSFGISHRLTERAFRSLQPWCRFD